MSQDLKKLLEQLNSQVAVMNKGADVQAAANTPPTTPGAEIESKALTGADQRERFVDPLRKTLEGLAGYNPMFAHLGADKVLENPYDAIRSKNESGHHRIVDASLGGMIAAQMEKGSGKEGVSFNQWIASTGRANAIETGIEAALSKGLFGENTSIMSRALTSGGSAGALIRTDLEPLLREAYLRKFPVAEQIGSIPANGLVHTYNVKTATGEAVTLGELGDLTGADADSIFSRRANSNIAIIASRRQISLKVQYASQQSGMNYNLTGSENTEVMSAVTAIARKNQSLILQGNYSTGSKTLDHEEGLTDTNAFDGLRTLLKSLAITKTDDDMFYDLVDKAVGQIMNAGGDVTNILGLMSVGAKRLLNAELMQFLRINKGESQAGGTPLNMVSTGLLTVADTLAKMLAVPASAQAQGCGYYTYSGNDTEDAFIVDPAGLQLAYLGSPNPVVLELPTGFNNALSNVYVVFMMNGLVLYIDGFHRKIRIPKQSV